MRWWWGLLCTNKLSCIFIVLVCGYTCHPTLTRYPDSEPTRFCSFSLMLCALQRSNKYQFYSLWFDLIEPTIYRTWGKYANHYTIDVVKFVTKCLYNVLSISWNIYIKLVRFEVLSIGWSVLDGNLLIMSKFKDKNWMPN
jgi:hypothetical protein